MKNTYSQTYNVFLKYLTFIVNYQLLVQYQIGFYEKKMIVF